MGFRVRIFIRQATQFEGMYIGEKILPHPPRPLAEVSFDHLGRNQRAVIEQITPADWRADAEAIPAIRVTVVAADS